MCTIKMYSSNRKGYMGASCPINSFNMRKYQFFKIATFIVFVSLALCMQSCNNDWKKHYKEELYQASDKRLGDYIQSVDELSKFAQMLAITGYDSILDASQTYTVWAPDNNALQDVDMNDIGLVTDIVKNHITRYSIPTSGVQSKYVKMINGKLILFSRNNDGFHFGSALITTPDMLTANGIVHVVNSYVPFQPNIWEYISRTEGFDSLKAYINSQHKKIFNLANSVAVSIDSLGNSVYDSAFIETNVLFNSIGDLDIEDSIYTAIIPDNTAWNEAYNRIKTYFVSNDPVNGAEIQRQHTQFSIVMDMVFRDRIYSPASRDSLVSTNDDVFHQPAYLFNGVSPVEVSNGIVYPTSLMQFKATDTWFNKIKVEAESSSGRSNLNSNIYLQYSFGSGMDVSNNSYIKVEPTTTSTISKVYVDFPIPYTLSAKYNIYCTFVPGIISNPNYKLPYRAVFYLLTYNKGLLVKTQQLTVQNNVTDPNGVTKMLVAANFPFSKCDVPLGSDSEYTPSIKLRVQNDVAIKDTATFSRTMRIDCVSFEPVVE